MSQRHKLENRLKLKQENDWLRNAFRTAMNAAIEQGDNAAELTKALAVAIQKSGGAVLVTKSDIAALDPSTMLRAETDKDTGTTTYSTTVVVRENSAEEEAVESE